MGRKRSKERVPKPRRARRSGTARLLAALLGLLMVGCAGVAAVAFAMPALLEGVVPLPSQSVGAVGVGGALVSALLLVLLVSRTRRRVAEAEFSRPELISVPVSDVEENAPLFPVEENLPAAAAGPLQAVPVAAVSNGGFAGASIFATLAEPSVAEPVPPLPDEVSFAPAAVAAPAIPASPVQPTPFAEPAPAPTATLVEEPPAEAPKAREREPGSLSGAWFAGPNKHRQK